MDNLTAGNPRAHRVRVYYEGTDTINEGMPLCYNYLTTDNWFGGSVSDEGVVTENTTTAEGSQNEGKYIRVIEPTVVDIDDGIPAASSKTITSSASGSHETDFNNIKVNQWVTITGTDVTAGTYKVTAVTQGTASPSVASTITLDMDDATSTTADVRVVINNSVHHAGAVARGGWCGNTGPRVLDVYVPNGAIIPIRTDKSCVVGDSLGLGSAAYSAATGDNDPLPCAVCVETVNRSSVNGVVLARIFDTSSLQMFIQPVRGVSVGGYVYGLQVDGTKILRGTTAAKSFVVQFSGTRESGYAATGDSNDAILKLQGSNYALNDTNFYFRGLNCSVANRGSGTLNVITNTISISLKSGSGNIGKGIALEIDAQDLTSGTKTEFGGLDIAINREGTAATTEYGLQIRTRGTINTAINTAIRITKDAADHGFVNLFNIESDAVDYAACGATTKTWDSSDIAIPIYAGSTTYYIYASDSNS